MMNRDFFPDMTEEFDARVRDTLSALPEKRRVRRMTAPPLASLPTPVLPSMVTMLLSPALSQIPTCSGVGLPWKL